VGVLDEDDPNVVELGEVTSTFPDLASPEGPVPMMVALLLTLPTAQRYFAIVSRDPTYTSPEREWRAFVRTSPDLRVDEGDWVVAAQREQFENVLLAKAKSARRFELGRREIVALVDEGTRSLVQIPTAPGGQVEFGSLAGESDNRPLADSRDHRGVIDTEDGRFLVASARPGTGLLETQGRDGTGVTRFAPFFEGDFEPTLLAPWMSDSEQVLVALRGASDFAISPTALALFEVDSFRFLPGAWVIGEDLGIAGSRVVDDDGRVFLVFPWAATIARVTPRP
jgi:hypothetical protein